MHRTSSLRGLLTAAVLATLAAHARAQTYAFSTLAGQSSSGSSDGTDGDARFNAPQGVAMDGSGNVYVADTRNQTIRKITPGGVVTTLAGTAGISGAADGPGSTARFNFPGGLAVDSSGNAFVADTRNHTIRKITPSGTVTTLAGKAGTRGSSDGAVSTARFASPQGVAVDGSGNVFVADSENCTIRKISAGGVVTTLAGTAGSSGSSAGTGSVARFGNPFGVAVDGSGNVFVSDSFSHGSSRNPAFDYTIRKITPDGFVATLVATSGSYQFPRSVDGIGSVAQIGEPRGVTVDGAGNVFFGDYDNRTIRRIAPDGTVTTLAGLSTGALDPGYADGTGSNARFSFVSGVAVDRGGNIFVADNNTIRKVTAGGVVTTFAGAANRIGAGADGTGGTARFIAPHGLAMDGGGNVVVADWNTVRKVTADGVVTTLAGTQGNFGSADGTGSAARFSRADAVAVDERGNVFVADGNMIRRIGAGAVVTTLAGSPGVFDAIDGAGSAAGFGFVEGIAVDRSGNVFTTDSRTHTIRKIAPDGVVTTLAGVANAAGSVDGTGSAARFYGPKGVAVDGQGSLFVADSYNNTIRKITAAGVVTTVAGMAGISGNADGLGNAARFYHPIGVALDGSGNLFVGDVQNNTIRKIAADGRVTSLAGTAGLGGVVDGIGGAVRFNFPDAVAVDGSGNVLVADSGRIRRIAPSGAVTTLAGGPTGPGNVDGVGNSARFDSPLGVAVDRSGNVFVADTYNDTIRKITLAGVVTTLAGKPGIEGFADGIGTDAGFSWPTGVAVDGSGNVFVADSGGSTIRKISPAGAVTTFVGGVSSIDSGPRGYADGIGRAARFDNPVALAIDDSGNIFVADQGNNVVRKVTPGGVVTTLRDPAANALHFSLTGIAVDRAGNVFVIDGDVIRKISAGGVVTALAGVEGVRGFRDGPGSSAWFNYPSSIAVDDRGNVFVAERGNNAIRMITPDGVVTTIGGFPLSPFNADSAGSADGLGSAARFNYPVGIAVDRNGNLYVADSFNNTIRRGVPLANPARLINFAILTALAGGETMTVGTIIGGAGTSGTKPMLVRAVGPSLAVFGVTGLLDDPKLEFYVGSTMTDENDNWGGAANMSAAFAQVGAFPFVAPASKDAALTAPVVVGANNSIQISGNAGAAGTVLAELYDATPAATLTPVTRRLVNASVLKDVGSGLTAGFVIDGSGTRTVLIRAIGPSLAVFGVTGLLADPKLELFDGRSQSIATNDNWGDTGVLFLGTLNPTTISAAFAQVGAFVLASPASKDAALLVTLTPGNYTVQVRSADNTTGVVLVEVYEVP